VDSNGRIVSYDEHELATIIRDQEKENVAVTTNAKTCKGIAYSKLRSLVNENGHVIVNRKQYGYIFNNGSHVCIRMNECNGKNLTKSGACENCYRIYRNNLKKTAYIKDKALEKEKTEIERLKRVSIQYLLSKEH